MFAFLCINFFLKILKSSTNKLEAKIQEIKQLVENFFFCIIQIDLWLMQLCSPSQGLITEFSEIKASTTSFYTHFLLARTQKPFIMLLSWLKPDLPRAASNVEELKLKILRYAQFKKDWVQAHSIKLINIDQIQNDQNRWNFDLEFDRKHF